MTCNTYLNWRSSNTSLHSAVFFQASAPHVATERSGKSWTPNFLSSPFKDIWAYQSFPYHPGDWHIDNLRLVVFDGKCRYVHLPKELLYMVSNPILIQFLPNELQMICSWGNCQLQHHNTSRSAMTSQCIILLWKDFIRSDLKRNGQLVARHPPPFRLVLYPMRSESSNVMLLLCFCCKASAELLQGSYHYCLSWANKRPPETRDTRLFIEQLIGTSAPLGDKIPNPLSLSEL